jgi:hypothetical protein
MIIRVAEWQKNAMSTKFPKESYHQLKDDFLRFLIGGSGGGGGGGWSQMFENVKQNVWITTFLFHLLRQFDRARRATLHVVFLTLSKPNRPKNESVSIL